MFEGFREVCLAVVGSTVHGRISKWYRQLEVWADWAENLRGAPMDGGELPARGGARGRDFGDDGRPPLRPANREECWRGASA